jgi:hypothetical protein
VAFLLLILFVSSAVVPLLSIQHTFVVWYQLVRDHLVLSDFRSYGIIFINLCSYKRCCGDSVNVFLALWDNIYDYCMRLAGLSGRAF